MADDEKDAPVTVTMKATQLHTYHGKEYDVGDTYDADEGDATTIEVQGKGVRADAAKPETPATKKKK
jgi:hypothetical protein